MLPTTLLSESIIDKLPAVIPAAAAVTLNCPDEGVPLVIPVS